MRAGLCRFGSDELRAESANLIEPTQPSDEHHRLMFTLFMLKQKNQMRMRERVLAENDITAQPTIPDATNAKMKLLVGERGKVHRKDIERGREPAYSITPVRQRRNALSERLDMIFEPVVFPGP